MSLLRPGVIKQHKLSMFIFFMRHTVCRIYDHGLLCLKYISCLFSDQIVILNTLFSVKDATKREYFLSPEEESIVYAHYEYVLHEFCTKFQPPMPRCVLVRTLFCSGLHHLFAACVLNCKKKTNQTFKSIL